MANQARTKLKRHPLAVEFTYDGEADAAYIYLNGPIPRGAARTAEVNGRPDIYLDFDKDGRLLGIEIIDARVLPSAIADFFRSTAPAGLAPSRATPIPKSSRDEDVGELVEALRRIENRLTEFQEDTGSPDCADALDIARAALAKHSAPPTEKV